MKTYISGGEERSGGMGERGGGEGGEEKAIISSEIGGV